MVQAIQNYYMLYLLLGLGVTVLAILVMRRAAKRKSMKLAEAKTDMVTKTETENREEGEN